MTSRFDSYKHAQQNKGDAKKNKDTADQLGGFLTGKLLIAMPSLEGGYFDKSVIYICGHDEKGALGIVINQPMTTLSFETILEQVDIKTPKDTDHFPKIYSGGPVETIRGFILHTLDMRQDDTLIVNDTLGLTNSVAMLRLIANGAEPENYLFALGYAGWDAQQLEDEIKDNVWLVSEAAPNLIFDDKDPEHIWEHCLQSMGIDPVHLNHVHGRA